MLFPDKVDTKLCEGSMLNQIFIHKQLTRSFVPVTPLHMRYKLVILSLSKKYTASYLS